MRNVNNLRGLHSVRTLHSARKRSIPRVQTSTYLDLYTLDKEKERLEKEGERLGIRNSTIAKRLKEIGREMNNLQKTESAIKSGGKVNSTEPAFTEKSGISKEWNKMSLSY